MKNVCIAGYGAVAPLHALCLQSMQNVYLYAVCDCDGHAVAECQASYDVVAYSDFDEMLLDKNIHCVHICTPHYLHYPMTEKALAAGKRVVAEKPVTTAPVDFEKLTALPGFCRACTIVQNRYNHCIRVLRERIAAGELGELRGIKGIVTRSRELACYTESDWKGKWSTGGRQPDQSGCAYAGFYGISVRSGILCPGRHEDPLFTGGN